MERQLTRPVGPSVTATLPDPSRLRVLPMLMRARSMIPSGPRGRRQKPQGPCASTCLRRARLRPWPAVADFRKLVFLRLLPSAWRRGVSTEVKKVTSDAWQAFWSLYPLVARAHFGEGSRAVLEVVVGRWRRCLQGVRDSSVFQRIQSWMVKCCEGMPDSFRPLAHLCPESCGCTSFSGALPSFCAGSCAS